MPAPWGALRELEALRLSPGRDALVAFAAPGGSGGHCPRSLRSCRGAPAGLEPGTEGEGARGSAGSRGGGGHTGHGSRGAAGRGRRLGLKSTRISKEICHLLFQDFRGLKVLGGTPSSASVLQRVHCSEGAWLGTAPPSTSLCACTCTIALWPGIACPTTLRQPKPRLSQITAS